MTRRLLAAALLLPTLALAQAQPEAASAAPAPPVATAAPAEQAPPVAIAAPAPAAPVAAPPPAAEPTWRLSVATGTGTVVEILDWLYSGMGLLFVGVEQRQTSRLELTARVDRELGRFRAGVTYNYTAWDTELFDSSGPRGSERDQVHSLMGHGFVRWIRKEYVELYSGLGVGVARWESSQTFDGNRYRNRGTYGAWQLHGIGVGAGTPSVRAFVEVGFGFEGVLVGGLAARF